MPRRAPAEKPDAMEFLTMISGPKVDLYVGPSKKHYNLPKLLLCHYSDFFDSCFNGGFIETLSQRLYLPEDRIEDFEILLEFMLRGTSPGSIKLTETGGSAMQRCIDFIRYADKYNLAEAAEVVYEPLKEALKFQYKDGKPTKVTSKMGKRVPRIAASDIELIFAVMPAGSPLRTLAAQGALSHNGMKQGYIEQEREVEGFAAAMLSEMRASIKSDFKWIDPISGLERK